MIIVRQDRKVIYNFNNVNCIDISKLGEKYYIRLFDNTYKGEGTGDCIGIYETEKRAKEVLKSIVEVYQANKTFECINDNVQSDVLNEILERKLPLFTYEMPEK